MFPHRPNNIDDVVPLLADNLLLSLQGLQLLLEEVRPAGGRNF